MDLHKIRRFVLFRREGSPYLFLEKACNGSGNGAAMQNTDQDILKYQKLYHWAHTLITSGVIKNMDKFPSETSLQKKFGYSRQTVRTALQQLEDEAIYLEGLLKRNVSGFIIEGTRSAFPNPNIRLYREIKKRNIPTLFIHNHYENQTFDSVEMSDEHAAYELTKILIEHGHRRIGGIFKYDEIAEHYIEFLTERGISVPRDLSLVSFDDPAWQEKNYSYRFPVKMNDGNSIRKL